MDQRFQLSEIVVSLYQAVLARIPSEAEIAIHVLGERTLDEVVAGIVGSEEALRRSRDGAIASFCQAGATQSCPITVSTTDVMGVVADSYERFVGRHPAFSEVVTRFGAIVDGASLQGAIADIAGSDEARDFRRRYGEGGPTPRGAFADYMARVYALCLHRRISEGEIDTWYRHHGAGKSLPELLHIIATSEEAVGKDAGLERWPPGTFVQLVYEIILGRGAAPPEIEHHRRAITSAGISRSGLVTSLFEHAARQAEETAAVNANDHSQALLFGHKDMLSATRWKARKEELAEADTGPPPVRGTRFPFVSGVKPLVSIITSLYRGGAFIEPFLENITRQTIFAEHCELLIIDANSPEGEYEKAEPFLKRFPNIRYQRHESRIGIYEAWNLCIAEARGAYCTNANLDDCRREDSLELQASTLDALPFVDVVYQNVLYSYGENLPFAEIERYGFSTDLPIISRYNLLEFNSPHNGPMWRRRLHEDVGLFNANFKSAADYEFWIRCRLAGKTFYKINDPHVAYYVNPRGLSTRSDTAGAAEANSITKTFNRRLIDEHLLVDDATYLSDLEALAGGSVAASSRYGLAQAALRKVSASSRDAARSAAVASA